MFYIMVLMTALLQLVCVLTWDHTEEMSIFSCLFKKQKHISVRKFCEENECLFNLSHNTVDVFLRGGGGGGAGEGV